MYANGECVSRPLLGNLTRIISSVVSGILRLHSGLLRSDSSTLCNKIIDMADDNSGETSDSQSILSQCQVMTTSTWESDTRVSRIRNERGLAAFTSSSSPKRLKYFRNFSNILTTDESRLPLWSKFKFEASLRTGGPAPGRGGHGVGRGCRAKEESRSREDGGISFKVSCSNGMETSTEPPPSSPLPNERPSQSGICDSNPQSSCPSVSINNNLSS
mmetsp:Transcript_17399/g.29480  ORF Transcript_17399/g.29480 Transcript_17399/m.29480 type:complete len:216 (+) Transcript_17399:559-1206(+)